ncbi:MAG TPA: HAD-IA family hydrolase [Usitatibacter sp.]|jgi:phosphoglycolate phosphatase|nr:HAD-IA family hydrolase [Usitatibacter sp.]
MKRYGLVVFDWDGTLMDSTHVIAASLRAACADVGITVPTEEDARYVIGLGLEDTFNHVAPGLDAQVRQRLSERYRFHFLAGEAQIPLYAGVREMLADLHGRGLRLAVATGKARRGLERALDATGLRPWFEATRCADEGFAKPHPDMLLMLLDLTGVEPAHAVMVGDTTHDLDLAANAGVDAVSVSYGAHPEALLASRPAAARCGSVAELHRWLAERG